MFYRKTTALWDHQSNIYLIISGGIFFFPTTLRTYRNPFEKMFLCLIVTSLHISKGKKKVPVRTLQVLPQPYGQMEVGGVTLDFIYSRHSDIVMKWIYQCFSVSALLNIFIGWHCEKPQTSQHQSAAAILFWKCTAIESIDTYMEPEPAEILQPLLQ